MDKLKGKNILIGKEPVNGRLMIAVEGCAKTATIGQYGAVPNCVSRCRPEQGVAHASLSVDNQGNMILRNMKPKNITFVNGSEIASKRVVFSNKIELGKDRYPVVLNLVIDMAKKIVMANNPYFHQQPSNNNPQQIKQPQTPPKRYNISHLYSIWQSLQDNKKQIQKKRDNINLIRSGCGIFTMCAMPCIYFFGPIGYALTGIGILGNIYSFIGVKGSNYYEVMEEINDDFQNQYVCPNPECKKFFGFINYNLLKNQLRNHKDQKMYCPRCGCELYE